jgi:SAM-dependent MidA family methyltransferase
MFCRIITILAILKIPPEILINNMSETNQCIICADYIVMYSPRQGYYKTYNAIF